jgi:hypothetical protein
LGELIDFRIAIVDEFGELDRQMQASKPIRERHEALRKQIALWFEGKPGDEPCVVEGRHYTVQASPRAHQTKVRSLSKLFTRLGKTLFLQLCSVPLTAVRNSLPEEEHEKFLSEDRTGHRTIRAVPKAKAA